MEQSEQSRTILHGWSLVEFPPDNIILEDFIMLSSITDHSAFTGSLISLLEKERKAGEEDYPIYRNRLRMTKTKENVFPNAVCLLCHRAVERVCKILLPYFPIGQSESM